MATGPNTLATGQAIVTYLTALVYPSTTTLVYTLAQLEQIKDVIDRVASGGACVEVYADMDSSAHKTFNGGIWDEQTWILLSMCSLNTPLLAEAIYNIRDALVQPFMQHYQLGNTIPGIFWSQLKPESGRFVRILRNGQYVQAHMIALDTKLQWQATLAL